MKSGTVHYKRRHFLCFVIKRAVPTKLVHPLFCQRFVSKRQILDLYTRSNLNNHWQNTTAFPHQEPDKKSLHESALLSQLHFKLPAKFKLVSVTSCLAGWPLSPCFKMAAADMPNFALLWKPVSQDSMNFRS